MLALVLVMLLCVAAGAGVVVYVMVEARREGRGEFWTPEGEELIAGARRTTEKVKARGEQLGRTAAERTKDLAARRPERGEQTTVSDQPGPHETSADNSVDANANADVTADGDVSADGDRYRAAS